MTDILLNKLKSRSGAQLQSRFSNFNFTLPNNVGRTYLKANEPITNIKKIQLMNLDVNIQEAFGNVNPVNQNVTLTIDTGSGVEEKTFSIPPGFYTPDQLKDTLKTAFAGLQATVPALDYVNFSFNQNTLRWTLSVVGAYLDVKVGETAAAPLDPITEKGTLDILGFNAVVSGTSVIGQIVSGLGITNQRYIKVSSQELNAGNNYLVALENKPGETLIQETDSPFFIPIGYTPQGTVHDEPVDYFITFQDKRIDTVDFQLQYQDGSPLDLRGNGYNITIKFLVGLPKFSGFKR